MAFLKKLFGSSDKSKGTRGASGDRGLYFFVKPFGCDEIIRVRIDPMNDLSQSEDGKSFYVRKVASGVKCFKRVEMEFNFNGGKQLVDTRIQGGELVTEADWLVWVGAQS
ncbi:MAG: hypothetical protein U0670_22715 [Anaerolineae bacterium]